MSENVLIVMTALPLTTGHTNLIDFAREFVGSYYKNNHVFVLLNSRSFEPIPGILRYEALLKRYAGDHDLVIAHCDRDDVPQNPSEHPDFWNYWKNLIKEYFPEDIDYVIASEEYGIELAKVLDATFVPYDIKREINHISGTEVRQNIVVNFGELDPDLAILMKKTVTLFGAESCGKTTMGKMLERCDVGTYVPEWARTYLELVGSHITTEKMEMICKGQYALQKNSQDFYDKFFIFQDTDLFSTIGYYKLWNRDKMPSWLEDAALETASDLYIVMNDKIPFEPDPLRYGVNKRESDTQYWIDLLEEYELPYYVVKETSLILQFTEIVNYLEEYFGINKIKEFRRT